MLPHDSFGERRSTRTTTPFSPDNVANIIDIARSE